LAVVRDPAEGCNDVDLDFGIGHSANMDFPGRKSIAAYRLFARSFFQ
jgi:hypothetical protein